MIVGLINTFKSLGSFWTFYTFRVPLKIGAHRVWHGHSHIEVSKNFFNKIWSHVDPSQNNSRRTNRQETFRYDLTLTERNEKSIENGENYSQFSMFRVSGEYLKYFPFVETIRSS